MDATCARRWSLRGVRAPSEGVTRHACIPVTYPHCRTGLRKRRATQRARGSSCPGSSSRVEGSSGLHGRPRHRRNVRVVTGRSAASTHHGCRVLRRRRLPTDPCPHRWMPRAAIGPHRVGGGAVAMRTWYVIMFTMSYLQSDHSMRPPIRDMSALRGRRKARGVNRARAGPLSSRGDAGTAWVYRPSVVHAVEAVRWRPLERCWRG